MTLTHNGQVYKLASTVVAGGVMGGLAEAIDVLVSRGVDPADMEFLIKPLSRPGTPGFVERSGVVFARKYAGHRRGAPKYEAVVAVEFTYREPPTMGSGDCGWDG